MERRNFLEATVGLGAVALAGCSDYELTWDLRTAGLKTEFRYQED